MILYLILLAVKAVNVLSQPTIVLKAPVNPVRETGMISIHCQVAGLDTGHEVSLTRQIGQKPNERLSWNDGLVSSVEERVYLAERQLEDGSVVYFLSITDVERNDAGFYTCSVFAGNIVIAESSVEVDVHYFPAKNNPVCHPTNLNVLMEGTPISFNCSSERGNPPVSIEWTRADRGKTRETNDITIEHVKGHIVYSVLTIVPTVADNGAVFLCTLSSDIFYDVSVSCHVGPIQVVANPNSPTSGHSGSDSRQPTTDVTAGKFDKETEHSKIPTSGGGTKESCRELCDSKSETSVFFWVLATVVAGTMCLIFLTTGIVLSVKMYNINNSRNTLAVGLALQQPRDDIYEHLEYRRGNVDVYMTLEKQRNQQIANKI